MKGKPLFAWHVTAALLLVGPLPLRAQIQFTNFQILGCQGGSNATATDGSGNFIIHTSNPSFSLSISTIGSSAGLVGNTANLAAFIDPVAAAGVQSLWRLDGNGTDSSSGGRNLTFGGYHAAGGAACVGPTPTYVNAKNVPQAPAFGGDLNQGMKALDALNACSDQYGQSGGTNLNFAGMSAFTIEMWVRWNSGPADLCTGGGCAGGAGNDHPLFANCETTASNDHCLLLLLRPGSPACNTPTLPSGAVTPYFAFFNDDVCGGDVSDGAWHHLAFVANGTSKFIYLDGRLASGGLVGPGPAAAYAGAARPSFIGGIPIGQPWGAGLMSNASLDSVRVWSSALSQGIIAAHALGQWFAIGPPGTPDSKFDGNLSGGYGGTDATKTSATNYNWAWGPPGAPFNGIFGPTRNIIPTSAGADKLVGMIFTETDTNEFIGQQTFTVNERQATMTPPSPPGMTSPFSPTQLTWAVPTWFCDSANTIYTFGVGTCGSGDCVNPLVTPAPQAPQASKTFSVPGASPNTRYNINVKASYTDTGGNGVTVGPSAATASTAAATLAFPPDVPGAPASAGKTSASMTLNLTVAVSSPPGNPVYTAISVEGSKDGGATFAQLSAYAAWSTSNPRTVVGLAKSSKYVFRARNQNLDSIATTPSAATAGSVITQPNTPPGFFGTTAQGTPGLACPKNQILWSWNPVASGSGGSTQYLVTDSAGGSISPGSLANCAACQTATTFLESPLLPNTTYVRKGYAYDGGAPVAPQDARFSDPSGVASAQTAAAANTAPNMLSGQSLVGGILWSWNAPPNLCAPQRYWIYDTHTGFLIPPSPYDSPGAVVSFTQAGLGPNAASSIVVAASDTIGGIGPLSLSATAYSQANAPLNLTFAGVSTGAIILQWNGNGNPAYTRYEVSQSPDNFTNVISTPVPLGANLTSNLTPIYGLQGGTTYFFRVRAFNGQASDLSGAVFTTFVFGSAQTLFGPPAITGAALSNTSIDWQWPSVAGVSQYQVYRTPPGGIQTTFNPPYAGTLHYTPGGLTTNTQYGVQVLALNGQGLPAASSLVNVYTAAVPPTAPGNDIVGVTSNSITYQWNPNGNPAGTFYEVDIATNSAFANVIATVTPSATSVKIIGLFPLTTYYAELRAYNGDLVPINPYTVLDSTRTDGDANVSQSSAPPTVYQIAAGAVGQWHFDESTGTATADASGFNNNGILSCVYGGCASTPTWTSGPVGLNSAVSLSGQTSSFVLIPDAAQYHFGTSLTLEAWVNPATPSEVNGAGILAKGPFNGEDFFLDVSGGAYRFSACPLTGGATPATANGPYATGQWTFVAGVYDSTAKSNTIYINGVASPITGSCPAGRAASTAVNVSVGNRRSGSLAYDLGFNGAVDEARIISGAYGAAQVQQDYAASFPSTVTLQGINARLQVVVPPSAFGGPATLYASADPVNHPLKVSVSELMLGLSSPPTGQLLIPSMLVEIVPIVNGAQFTGPLGSSATIIMNYPDANNTGLIDGVRPPIAASTLRFYTLDTSIGKWVMLPSTVDLVAHRIIAQTPHFSVFGPGGTPTTGVTTTETRVYPVPWKIGSGGIFDAPNLTFDTLPSQGTLRLFTLSGQKVVDLAFFPGNAGKVVWNGLNFNGNPAASGVYFAYIKSADGSTRVLKFAIER